MNRIIFLFVILILICAVDSSAFGEETKANPVIVNANDLPKGFHDIESAPKLEISHTPEGWPLYQVESVKYYLTLLDIKPDVHVPLTTYLIKEKYTVKITEGMEGSQSKIVLELWELGTTRVNKRIWRLSCEADKWQFSSMTEIVLIKYGCCGEPNKYYYYDIKTGKRGSISGVGPQ